MTRRRKPVAPALTVSPDVLAANAHVAAILQGAATTTADAERALKPEQNRSRASGHAHALNIQDYAPRRLTMAERAAALFCNLAALMPPPTSDYYRLLPPGARMAVDACKRESAQLLKITGGQSHERT